MKGVAGGGGTCNTAPGSSDDACPGHSQRLRQRQSGEFRVPFRLGESVSGRCEFGLSSRLLCTGPKLTLHQRPHGVGKSLQTFDIRLSGLERCVRGQYAEIRVGGSARDVELRHSALSLCESGLGPRQIYGRATPPKINGFPREQQATGAAPDAVNVSVGSTGPETAGITDCGSSNPKTLLRVPRFTCHKKSSRGKYAVRATLTSAEAAAEPARASRIAG